LEAALMLQSNVPRNLAALVLTLAAGFAIYFIIQGDSARSDSTQLTGAAARVASEFGVLASPQTTADSLPSEPTVSGTAVRHVGRPSATEWMTISNARLCVQDRSGAFVCVPVGNYAGRPLVMEPGGASGADRIIGIAPDGVTSVTVLLPDGSTKTADVVNNGFSMALSGSAKAIQWTTSDGVNHTSEGSQG
jgi:hypothetical protein